MKTMIKNNNLFYLTFCCMLFSCTHNIYDLNRQEVHFEELPLVVQDTLILLSEPSINRSDLERFIFFEEERDKYDTKRLELGPFVRGYVLIDKEKKWKYKINRGTPPPYIVHDNILYYPVNFNVLFEKKIKNEIFEKYELK